jgi:glycosyltransferase involved in cell wall biosynthesis
MNEESILTAVIFAFNHEETIARCIESLLNQKTNYKYEIHLCDDCSQDDTQVICWDYANQYSDKIKLFQQKQNTFLLPYKQTQSYQAVQRLKTKYFCIIEGDDYWIAENKLQLALDFLENNPEYAGFAHDTLQVNEFDGTSLSYVHDIFKYEISNPVKLNAQPPFLLTSSRVFRNFNFKNVGIWPVDYLVYYYHLRQGPVHYHDQIMAAYTFGKNGTWATLGEMGGDMNAMFAYKLSQLFDFQEDDFCMGMQKWYDDTCHNKKRDSWHRRLVRLKNIFGIKLGWKLWFIWRFVRKYGFESMDMNYVYPRKIVKKAADQRQECKQR